MTEEYIDAVCTEWAWRSQRAWTLDLTVLGETYQVNLDDLGLERYVLAPREREQIHHGRAVASKDVYRRDAATVR